MLQGALEIKKEFLNRKERFGVLRLVAALVRLDLSRRDCESHKLASTSRGRSKAATSRSTPKRSFPFNFF